MEDGTVWKEDGTVWWRTWQGHASAPRPVKGVIDVSKILTPRLKREPSGELTRDEAIEAWAKLPELLRNLRHLYKQGDVLFVGDAYRADEHGFAFFDKREKERLYSVPGYGVDSLNPEK